MASTGTLQESEELLLRSQAAVTRLPGADQRLLNTVIDACAKAVGRSLRVGNLRDEWLGMSDMISFRKS